MRVLSNVRRGRSEEHASLEVIAAATDSDQPCVVLARDFDERVASLAGASDRPDVQRRRNIGDTLARPSEQRVDVQGGFDERLG